MADAPYVNTGIPMQKSQRVSKQKIFWIQNQKILLEESVHMYKILWVLNTVGSWPNALLVRRLWYKRKDLLQGGVDTTLDRYEYTYYIV